jgi:[ribosomal protein S18]-alanine N-acetyltransferase
LARHEFLVPLFLAVAEEARTQGRGAQFNWSEAQIRDALSKYDCVWRKEGERPVAFLLTRTCGPDYEILALGVEPAERGLGHMQHLLGDWLEQIFEPTAQVFLEVHVDNSSAIRLYTRLRFEVISRRPKYYSDGGEALLLRRQSGIKLR